MTKARLPAADPRTIARDIPGVLDSLFPQLNAGVVAYYNQKATRSALVTRVPEVLIAASSLNRAMLFEIAFAGAEQLIAGRSAIAWVEALSVAGKRQRRHFDAMVPAVLNQADIDAALAVARNLAAIVNEMSQRLGAPAVLAPRVPGFEWIASSTGDFAVGDQLLEVKCSSRNFGSADYRQLMMYWLLSFSASVQSSGMEWRRGALVNPRLNLAVEIEFDDLLYTISSGRAKLELLNVFRCMVGTRHKS